MPHGDLQTLKSFVVAARKYHNELHYAIVRENLWSQYILETTTIPNMPNIQVNSNGVLIPDDNEYYWYNGNNCIYNVVYRYNQYTNYNQHLRPLDIKLPISLDPLRGVMEATKLSLNNNFFHV